MDKQWLRSGGNMEFEVGELVKVKEGLIIGECYGKLDLKFTKSMEKLEDKPFIISTVSCNFYLLEDLEEVVCKHMWNDEMLERY